MDYREKSGVSRHIFIPCALQLKFTCDVNLFSKLSIIFKEWRVMNNVDRGGVIVLFIL
jgi:hypothetical protein